MRRNPLNGRDGDRINAVPSAAGYNFSRLAATLVRGPETFFTDDQGRGGWQTVDALKKEAAKRRPLNLWKPLASYAAALRRRLAKASSPPAASISAGTPAPTMGPGTA